MKLFPQDNDVVTYETGFDDDLLERKKISKQLSELVEKVNSPTVIALDDKWGSGKSYFLKRWVAAHQSDNEGTATTVYFDAFENDYLSDPLVSLIASVSERIPIEQEETIRRWKDTAKKLAKPTLGVALSLATFGAKQYLDDMGDTIVEAVSSEAKDTVPDIWQIEKERQDAMQSFRELLVELTENTNAPIVIVIDELDRCRPDFALSVLEIIKHFFSVPKVHFVLGINGSALENSVRARYGADMDAESYLRKFINVSFSLPRFIGNNHDEAAIVSYATQMSSRMELPNRLANRCIELLKCVSKENYVSLRDVGKVLSKIALLPSTASETNWTDGYLDTICILLVSSVVCSKFHKDLISGNATADDMMSFIGATKLNTSERIGDESNQEYDHQVTVWLAVMLFPNHYEHLKAMDHISDFIKEGMGKYFDRFGGIREPKSFVSRIQRDLVDVFRM